MGYRRSRRACTLACRLEGNGVWASCSGRLTLVLAEPDAQAHVDLAFCNVTGEVCCLLGLYPQVTQASGMSHAGQYLEPTMCLSTLQYRQQTCSVRFRFGYAFTHFTRALEVGSKKAARLVSCSVLLV